MSVAQAEAARRPGPDAQAIMMFESRKKSVAVAYLIWLLFASVGGHRFYAGKTASGLAMVILSITGWILLLFSFSFLLLGVAGLWSLVDAFLIPGLIRDYNSRLAAELGGGPGLEPALSTATANDFDPDAGARADAVIARYLERNPSREPSRPRQEDRPPAKSFGQRVRAP